VLVGDRPAGLPTEPATVDLDPGALAAALTHRITTS
jgi:hypothetical protein